ncbi:MAG: putative membrane protein insertion efficiency factor [Chlamydiae bacterium]|nr:putative membrane protein insertion efficiency factor [Chlamydiota bacterium]
MRKLLPLLLFPTLLYSEIGYIEPWGRDARISASRPQKTSPPRKLSPMGRLSEQVILFHHNVLTHISGPRSHYRPTSSQYMLEAIRQHGFMKGYIMGCDRLLRENGDPWHYRTKEIKGKLYKWDPPL